MLRIKAFRDTAKGVPDLLDWAALVDEGIVQGKSGALMAGYFYKAPDLASSTPSELNYLTERVNASLLKLGNGWVTWHEAVRMPAPGYPERELSSFPDDISALIDEERRQAFEAEEAHFETEFALVFLYTPPLASKSRLGELVFDDDGMTKTSLADRILAGFKKTLGDIEDSLGDVIQMRRMGGFTVTDAYGRDHLRDELLNFLQQTLTGEVASLNVPSYGMYLDAVLGGQELWGGITPKLGTKFISVVAIEGFPGESSPGVLEILNNLPIAYRWSTRMIYLDQHEAIKELDRYRRKWLQRVRGFWTQVFRTQGGTINEDALLMAEQSTAAKNEAQSSLVTFGYYTAVVVLMHEDREVLSEHSRFVSREVQRLGFSCRVETVNTLEAWLGSLPGHPLPNIRRPLIHTLNLADLLPLSTVWAGLDQNPCPLYPPNSPPLMYAATHGATVFRLNLHVGDTGHTLVLGPTGSGKSVLLATIAVQFLRYQRATVCCFDKGRSMWAVAEACGGRNYDIGSEREGAAFCPLGSLEDASDVAWAEDWIATCFQLQTGTAPSPSQKIAIHRALGLLKQSPARSLTDFLLSVQDNEIREALSYYTLDGALGHLLDSKSDEVRDSHFTVFELEELMGMGERNVLPVILYLFRRFERSLKGQPALLVLDEAWLMLAHPVFREKIREWLKVLRKANCVVLLATQSLSDAVRSGILDVLIEQCPTKIVLPNSDADKTGTSESPGPRDFYAAFGFNDREIEIVRTSIKKRQYYFTSPEGRRLFELNLGPIARCFVASSDKETLAEMRHLKEKYGRDWPLQWLDQRRVPYDASVVSQEGATGDGHRLRALEPGNRTLAGHSGI